MCVCVYLPTCTRVASRGQAAGSKASEEAGEVAVYKRVAVVENFYDIIYNVHVEMDGRSGKHAGQKRTYRAVSNQSGRVPTELTGVRALARVARLFRSQVAEMYAFLPREAVTRFLMSCSDCQKRMHLQGVPPSDMPVPTSPPASRVGEHKMGNGKKR